MSMRWLLFSLLLALATPANSLSQESLRYSINWPSGLSLGEGSLTTAKSSAGGWDVNFQVEASLPGFTLSEQVRSAMSAEFCSTELEKNVVRGRRRGNETTTFEKGKATRQTKNGGKSQIDTQACGRDVLAFLQFARQELAHGRVPAPSTVLYGAPYRIRMDFAGTQTVKVSEQPVTADKLNVTVKGPQADVTFEAFFARDAQRTPVLIRVPFTLGTFSLELVK